MSREKRILLDIAGQVDPVSVKDYVSKGGYRALRRAADMEGNAIIDELCASGLLGRGGAGFPTGRKWRTLWGVMDEPKYIVCNADEGEPGTYKDRELLRQVPLKVVEGMTIAARTFGAKKGYIFVRGEYLNIVGALNHALENAREAGYLGKNILGRSGFDFDIAVVTGASSYVCGEETALLNTIEGNRGEPRLRPPYPAEKGLYGKPTLVNNAETFANVTLILDKGASWFTSLGTESGHGTKLLSIAGHSKQRGVFEVELGSVTLKDILYGEDFGAGTSTGRQVKFFHLGGQSGYVGFPEQMFTPYDYGALNMVGLTIGSGAFVVMDDSVCLVDYCRKVAEFFVGESCGKCSACRIGTVHMLKLLTDLAGGRGMPGDIDRLEEMANAVSRLSACGLGQASGKAITSCLRHRRDEFIAHVQGNCPARFCKMAEVD
ncbi:MAG: complex I 51 kDa subunit family protein [Oscillospiraceae bacterium]